MRLQNINNLQLPYQWAGLIDPIVFNNRMEMELWMESANSDDEWVSKLKSRGYKEIPNIIRPELWLRTVKTAVPDPPELAYKSRKAATLDPDVLLRLNHSKNAK